eukprot:CAMPEP_0202037464 /NCGR_PEP_ID=MMETSP0962-20130828/2187_1 /ASSEMBLY_ACC=CAM_ASM_000488 /TAXON_ID=4773 /ORGANISM="Schizochytrium aggregatum, Strain ATCC28209" /LENGTH=88 /DNA_ID=CAMNT_0048601583 /DNA_START=593 /DNA_END=860 /DNA_ORIENTATION=-
MTAAPELAGVHRVEVVQDRARRIAAKKLRSGLCGVGSHGWGWCLVRHRAGVRLKEGEKEAAALRVLSLVASDRGSRSSSAWGSSSEQE